MHGNGMTRARVRRTVLLAALSQLAIPAQARWIAYTSDHFTLYSEAREDEAVEVIENFEVFRQAALSMLGLPDASESGRLLILMFEQRRDFSRIRPGPGVGGFFYNSLFGPRMIVGPSGGAENTQEVLFHEYVHYLMNRHSAFNYPRWYSEGLAQLLSTADIDETSIVIGRPPQSHALAISYDRDTTIRDVIGVDFHDTMLEFYVTSWLMTHYFLIDSASAATRRAQTLDYLRRYDAGEDPIEAFAASYGLTVDEMQKELTNYTRRRELTGIRFPRGEYGGSLVSRPLDPGEASYLLGNVAVETDNLEAAHDFFDDFADVADASPLRAKVTSRRAIAFMHEEKPAEGDGLIEQLVSTGIADADVLADIAHYAYDRFVHAKENDQGSAAFHVERSIDFGGRAVAHDSADLQALFYLGLAHEARGDLQQAANALLSAYNLNRSIPRLNLNLARVVIKGQQPEYASYFLSRVYSATHSEEMRAKIRQIQQDIAEGDADIEALNSLL